jgi:Cu(I)/Ag(I) efflux system membrane fusion protein
MKIRISALVLGSLLLGAVTSIHASEALKAIVGSYLEIQTKLASDKLDGIKAPADAIAAKADGMGESGGAMAKSAKALSAAKDLKTVREAFGQLSHAVIAAAKAEGWKDLGGVKVAYCPMVDRSWLQKEEKIRNPYYGSLMLECGEFKK